jgi:shikimate dehydrogenase
VKFLVVGSPVAHSLSPVMMKAAFRAAGLEATYEAREIAPEDWAEAMDDLWRGGVQGVNVTVPHKERALASATDVSAVAEAIGAANVLTRGDDGWRADNTDGPGFRDWIEELGRGSLLEREVLVLGAGGSARAVVWAALAAGSYRVRVACRTRKRGLALAKRHADRIDVEEFGVDPPAGGLVVNCTPLGLSSGDPLPLPVDAIARAGLVVDLVYPETPLVRAARAAGVAAEDGVGLLVAQGVLSFGRWTGGVADPKVMRMAVEEELALRARDPA